MKYREIFDSIIPKSGCTSWNQKLPELLGFTLGYDTSGQNSLAMFNKFRRLKWFAVIQGSAWVLRKKSVWSWYRLASLNICLLIWILVYQWHVNTMADLSIFYLKLKSRKISFCPLYHFSVQYDCPILCKTSEESVYQERSYWQSIFCAWFRFLTNFGRISYTVTGHSFNFVQLDCIFQCYHVINFHVQFMLHHFLFESIDPVTTVVTQPICGLFY